METETHAENWLNGNRSDVREAIEALPPLQAAHFAVAIYFELRVIGFDEADSFFAWLAKIA